MALVTIPIIDDLKAAGALGSFWEAHFLMFHPICFLAFSVAVGRLVATSASLTRFLAAGSAWFVACKRRGGHDISGGGDPVATQFMCPSLSTVLASTYRCFC